MAIWFVTGAARGLGRALLDDLVENGHDVVAAVRDPASLAAYAGNDRVLPVEVDVRDREQIRLAVDAALESFGRIDVLVNNAGYGLLGAVEETSLEEARSLFEVNFFGLLAVTQAVLPVMRRQHSGRIINISSVGGFAALPGSSIYGATKFAIEAVSEGLRAELLGSGVHVHLIEPGAFRTDFLDGRSIRLTAQSLPPYDETVHDGQPDFLAASGSQAGDPMRAATIIRELVDGGELPFRLQLGADSVARVEAKLDFVRAELDLWRDVAESTSFDARPR